MDVSVAELFDYLGLPRQWALGDLARGIWVDNSYDPVATAKLLRELSDAFEVPPGKLRELLVHAVPRYLRSSKRPFGCLACAEKDARVRLRPRIQRHWLLRYTKHCDIHGLPLQYLDSPPKRSARRSAPMQDDFVAQIRYGLLLGWDPECGPSGPALLDAFLAHNGHSRSTRDRSALAASPIKRSIVWAWCVSAPAGKIRAEPLLLAKRTLAIELIDKIDLFRRGLVVGRAIGDRSDSDRIEPSTVLAAARTALDQLVLRLTGTRQILAQRLADLTSRIMGGVSVPRARVDELAQRLSLAGKTIRSKAVLSERRLSLRAEIAQARARLGPELDGEVKDLRRKTRTYLDAAKLHDIDPACPADMVRLYRACAFGTLRVDRGGQGAGPPVG